MTTTKAIHTSGPWHVGEAIHEFQDGSSWRVPVWADNAASGDKIALEATAMDREQARATARIAAAAPDLLAACEFALPALEAIHEGGMDHCYEIDKLRATILKARGE